MLTPMCCIACDAVSESLNGTTAAMEFPWSEAEKWLLVAVLSLEMVLGIVGNCLVLLVKVMVMYELYASI